MSSADSACPVCSKPVPTAAVTAPFCCERCKMVDLGRWFRGEYVVAGEAAVAFDPELLEDAGDGGGPSDQEA